MTCWNFFCSAVFSMPVWRYPIVGEHETTVSPSSSSTSRSTPCVLGCCGPMFTVIVSVRSSGIVLRSAVPRARARASSVLSCARCLVGGEVSAEFFLGHLQRFRRPRLQPDLDREILAQRVTFPVLGHQETPQIAVALEDDPE